MNNAFDRVRENGRLKILLPMVVLMLLLTGSVAYGQGVNLFEGKNLGGESILFGLGDHRLQDFAHFNDRASSMRITPGYVVILYTDADEGGGYGFYVDFLEDCPDLSKYNFDKKVSYVTFFSATKPGYFWARNALINGVFTPGHWERSRAGGNPVNHVAMVGPQLPPHTTTTTTTTTATTKIQKNGAITTILSLGPQNPGFASRWLTAQNDQLGVIGSDYNGPEEIGSAAFERASNNKLIPDSINFWYPQKPPNNGGLVFFKRTLAGTVDATVDGKLESQNKSGEDESDSTTEPHIADVNGTYEDHDFNVDIKPSAKYTYLITQAHPPALSIAQSAKLTKENLRLHNATGEYNNPCTQPFNRLEAEIDARLEAKSALSFLIRGRVGKSLAVYGPWIYDKGHCYQPEIHPAEEIWWSEADGNGNVKYSLNLFCDASKRFWWRDQMDDGTKLKPWGAPPIKGTFAIAFEVQIGKPGQKFEVSNIEDYNVVEYPNTDQVYNLVYQNQTLVSFIPHNNAFIAYYDEVGLKPGTTNVIRGFLVLKTSVGTLTQKNSGHLRCLTDLPPHIVDVPRLADVNTVDQCVEHDAFEKVEGHYLFSVLRTNLR